MKKLVALFLTMVMLLSLAGGVAAEEGKYTLSDVTNVLKYVAGWGDKYRLDSYDYDGNGTVSLYDATCILKAIVGWDEDSICLKKPSDEYIKDLEAALSAYYTSENNNGIDYDIRVVDYYGKYNGADVVLYCCYGMDYPFWVQREDVAGYTFYSSDGKYIEVWKDGKTYSLSKAYEGGILDEEDLKKIYEINLRSFPYEPSEID